MRLFRYRLAAPDASANDVAAHAAPHSRGIQPTTVISAVALLFSAYNLWETSLKQADLSVYASGVVTYERDISADEHIQPTGGFEVFAVPITIANSGARDAPVLALQLDVSNPKTGLSARFEATYTVDAAYFAGTSTKRPKTPLSAPVIAGRSAWMGTVLFYPVSYSNGKALTPVRKVREFNDELRKKYANESAANSSSSSAAGVSIRLERLPEDIPERADLDAYRAKVLNQNEKVEVTLKLISPAPRGWLDRLLDAPVRPITFTLDLPDIPGDRVARGELVRLRTVGARS
jgi:hypothetical protein